MCDDLLDADPRALDAESLGAHIAGLEALVRRAQAAQAAAVRVFEVRDCADALDAPSAKAWLRSEIGLSDKEAASVVGLGRAMEGLPATAAVFAAGRASAAHVRLLAAGARPLPDDVVADGDAFLAPTAAVLDSRRFAVVVQRWIARVAPAAFERDSERRYESRWLSLAETYGGMHSIAGMLDPEAGQLLAGALSGLMATDPADDTRSLGQRRADALADLTRLALSADPAAPGGAPVAEIVVHVDAAHLDEPGDVPVHVPDLAGAGPVPATTLDRLGCDARWRRLVLDAAKVPIELGRATRTIPAGLRKLVAIRDGGCRYPGCVRGAALCDAHHVVFWRHGGPTDAANLVLLCGYHHHLVHDRHHRLARGPDGRVTVTRPDGRVVGEDPRRLSMVARL